MTGRSRPRANSTRAALSALVAAGSVLLVLATPAAASVASGPATITRPGGTAGAALPSGGARIPFTVALPTNAACSGDTAHEGYHVYSYLVPAGTDLSKVTFVNFPSAGYGLVDSSGTSSPTTHSPATARGADAGVGSAGTGGPGTASGSPGLPGGAVGQQGAGATVGSPAAGDLPLAAAGAGALALVAGLLLLLGRNWRASSTSPTHGSVL